MISRRCLSEELPGCPLVSIITPSFNSARFIAETIESVRKQNYPYLEHIVIDGNSTDATLEILRSYPHLIWLSEPDNGQANALNKGLMIAKGEIIGWLNADDTYRPRAVQEAVRFLMKNPDYDGVYSDLQIVDQMGLPVHVCKSRPFDLAALFEENFIRQPTVFLRKRVLSSLGGVNEDLHYSMDRELWLRIGSYYKLHYISNFIGANFRLHGASKTSQKSPCFHSEWAKVMEQAILDPRYQNIPIAVKHKAIQKAHVRFHITSIKTAISSFNTKILLHHLYMLVRQNYRYILDYPCWRSMPARLLRTVVNKILD
jgi:glycosyltransferase involved in cell wall biosynthesis